MDRKTFMISLCSAMALGCLRAQSAPSAPAKKALIVYFSWSGNTRGIAKKIKSIIGADIAELELEKPYSRNYNTCLDEALSDQKKRARPKLKNSFENLGDYGSILLGYPNWWASIPMPIATFLESYDFKGKAIIPFCSHGGGRLGQSVSAIAKLCPGSPIKTPLSVHYSGGRSLAKDLDEWLTKNGLK